MAGQMVIIPQQRPHRRGLSRDARVAAKAPGVVVMQEWWGLVPHIKDVADRFAAAGYLALAPDLYHGKTTTEPDEAGKMMMSMKMDEAAKDMAGAFDFLKSHDACTGKIGSVGFCLGGGLSLYLATLRPVDACVIYYGALPGVQPDLAKINGAVLGHYAENDGWATPGGGRRARRSRSATPASRSSSTSTPAPSTPSSTTRAPRCTTPPRRSTSWERTLAFYKKHLG